MVTPETIAAYLEADHRRLEALLEKASAHEDIDHAAYDAFRQGILKHIGIEEKLLLPRAQRLGGRVLERAAKLRLDHGAIAALLTLSPTHKVIHALETILQVHNEIEEGMDGVYAECDRLLGEESQALMEEIIRYPPVPVAARIQSEALVNAAKRCLERAGYSGSLLD